MKNCEGIPSAYDGGYKYCGGRPCWEEERRRGGFPPAFHLSHVNWLPLQPGGEGKLLPEAKKGKSRRLDTRYRFFWPERSVTTVLRSRKKTTFVQY